jgi:hypothetical protein
VPRAHGVKVHSLPSHALPIKYAELDWKLHACNAIGNLSQHSVGAPTPSTNAQPSYARPTVVIQCSTRPGNGKVTAAILRRKATCTVENKRGILPDVVAADDLVLWYASCLRGSMAYNKAVQCEQVTLRPADATRWRSGCIKCIIKCCLYITMRTSGGLYNETMWPAVGRPSLP